MEYFRNRGCSRMYVSLRVAVGFALSTAHACRNYVVCRSSEIVLGIAFDTTFVTKELCSQLMDDTSDVMSFGR